MVDQNNHMAHAVDSEPKQDSGMLEKAG